MRGKMQVGVTLLTAATMAVSAVMPVAAGTRVETAAFGNATFEATLTYTEEAAVKIRDANKPKDKDDTDFSVRINANFKRTVDIKNDGEGMTVHECMEFNPDGGCRTYSPLSYGGSIVYHLEHKMHTENGPNELPDVYDDNSVGDFSGVLTSESVATVTEVNMASLLFDLHAGMKGTCEGLITHAWSTMDNGTNPPRQISHNDSKTVKKCSEDWVHAAYEPSDVSGVKADGSDAPEMRELRINVVSCNVNPDACAQGNLGDAGAMVIATGDDWYGAVATGNMQTGYKFHLEQPRDVGKFMLKDAGGTWKRDLIVDAKITPNGKPGRGLAGNLAPRPDLDRLETRKPAFQQPRIV